MTGVVWEDPPPQAGGSGSRVVYTEEVAALRSRPGEWGRIPVRRSGERAATMLADNIRRGLLAAFRPAGSFEAKAFQGQVWARYTDGGQS